MSCPRELGKRRVVPDLARAGIVTFALNVSLRTLLGRVWFACPTDRHIEEQLVAQVRLGVLEVFLELVSTRPTCDGGSWGSSPNAAIARRRRARSWRSESAE